MSPEEKKLRRKETYKKYREKNKEKCIERTKKWRKINKEKVCLLTKKWLDKHPNYKKEYDRNRRKTKLGRAENLLRIYKQSDEKNNRGKCTLTAKWIVDNIFSKKCSYCEENDWAKLGCNRLNNSLPHTPENVEPCCFKCNAKLRGKDIIEEQSKQVYQYTTDGNLIAIWKSANEIQRKLSFNKSCISRCCNGKTKYSYGYKWSYIPLN